MSDDTERDGRTSEDAILIDVLEEGEGEGRQSAPVAIAARTRRTRAPLPLLRMIGQDSHAAGMLQTLAPGRYASRMHPDPSVQGERLDFLTPFTGAISFEIDRNGDVRNVEMQIGHDVVYQSWPSHRIVAHRKGALRRMDGRFSIMGRLSCDRYVAERPATKDGVVTMQIHTRSAAISDAAIEKAGTPCDPDRIEDDPDVVMDVVGSHAMPIPAVPRSGVPTATLVWTNDDSNHPKPMLLIRPVLGIRLPNGGIHDAATDSWACHARMIRDVVGYVGSLDVLLGGREDRAMRLKSPGRSYRTTRIHPGLHRLLIDHAVDPANLAAQNGGLHTVHAGRGCGLRGAADFLPPSFPSGSVSYDGRWRFVPSSGSGGQAIIDVEPDERRPRPDPIEKPIPDSTPTTWTNEDGTVCWAGDVESTMSIVSQPIDHARELEKLLESAASFWTMSQPAEWSTCRLTIEGRSTKGTSHDEPVLTIQINDALEAGGFASATSDLDMSVNGFVFRASPRKVDVAVLMATLADMVSDMVVTCGPYVFGMVSDPVRLPIPDRIRPDGDGCMVEGPSGTSISLTVPPGLDLIDMVDDDPFLPRPGMPCDILRDVGPGADAYRLEEECDGTIEMHEERVDPKAERMAIELLDVLRPIESPIGNVAPDRVEPGRLDLAASLVVEEAMSAVVRTVMAMLPYSRGSSSIGSIRKASDLLRSRLEEDTAKRISAYVDLLEAESRERDRD